jgi:hypothetical protein
MIARTFQIKARGSQVSQQTEEEEEEEEEV